MISLGDGPLRGKAERDIILGELRLARVVHIITEEDDVEVLDRNCPAAQMPPGIVIPSLKSSYHEETRYGVEGRLRGWTLRRAWYYWVASCERPEDEVGAKDALILYERFEKDLRVNGHCGCPPPTGAVGLYHIDSQEAFNALCAYLIMRGAGNDKEGNAAHKAAMAREEWGFRPVPRNDGWL